jgi:hypothetical protein
MLTILDHLLSNCSILRQKKTDIRTLACACAFKILRRLDHFIKKKKNVAKIDKLFVENTPSFNLNKKKKNMFYMKCSGLVTRLTMGGSVAELESRLVCSLGGMQFKYQRGMCNACLFCLGISLQS